MIFPELVEGALALQPVDGREGALAVLGAGIGPGGEECRGEIHLAVALAAGDLGAGVVVSALLQVAHAEGELRQIVRWIAQRQPLGGPDRPRSSSRCRGTRRNRAREAPGCADPPGSPRGRRSSRPPCRGTRPRYRPTRKFPSRLKAGLIVSGGSVLAAWAGTAASASDRERKNRQALAGQRQNKGSH